MASDPIILNNYSDDSQIKRYIANTLMPRVFHDIPLNVLNTGMTSIISEYMSQALENLGFQSSFYLNESFITKAMLADSIYAEAAIFDIGYSFATPSSCNFMLELRISDIIKNAVLNADNGLYEFILDKNTKFNLSNGNVYSLDYDILIQYQKVETATVSGTSVPAWNVQYTNMDESNVVATNKTPYILYRVSETWLCLFINASEYERQTHVIVNNMTNEIPNTDKTITCLNHIAGFDVKYIDGSGNEEYLDRDHILPIHSDAKDLKPYIHYIMDNPQTIRFMFQLNGTRYFVPKLNSSFEITIYTCHGEAANFTAFKNDEQPAVITSSNRYSNNGNVMKTAFVISGSMAGTNIGTIETVRRETIEAYNTANQIATDHDIYEWFKTFLFKNILYPFFFKRRDDPWGRIWSGFIALKDTDDTVFRTNTVHGRIPYRVLYANNDNIITNNEIIIPPGWVWTYVLGDGNRYAVAPLVASDGTQVETAKTAMNINAPFAFANPFGIRIQKDPFAIAYFNPWIDQYATASIIPMTHAYSQENDADDISVIYHATPTVVNIKRTYQNDYYLLTVLVSPTTTGKTDGTPFVSYVRMNTVEPKFSEVMWDYFQKPSDLYATRIPILIQNADDQYVIFDPERTFFCVRSKYQTEDNKWVLSDFWIEDRTQEETKIVHIPMTGFDNVFGTDSTWGLDGLWKGYEVMVSGDVEIDVYPVLDDDSPLEFRRVPSQNYYELRLRDKAEIGTIVSITTGEVYRTELTKYGETTLYRIGKSYSPGVFINIAYSDGTTATYQIRNSANIYMPYIPINNGDGTFTFELNEVAAEGIILYADMKPTPSDAAVDYYRIPFSLIKKDTPIFYLSSSQLPVDKNDLRVVLDAKINGSLTGRIEMQPVQLESDGSIRFETVMYPLNKMVDVDNRIQIASLEHGGGSWIPAVEGGVVTVDATTPEFQLSILFRSDDTQRPSEIEGDASYIGYRVSDRWKLDDISLVQELKEMRSVVNFNEQLPPSADEIAVYEALLQMMQQDVDNRNLYTLYQYVYHVITDTIDDSGMTFDDARVIARETLDDINDLIRGMDLHTDEIQNVCNMLEDLVTSTDIDTVNWQNVYEVLVGWTDVVESMFKNTSVNSHVEVQLMPVVQSSLMNSDRFETFVAAFTQVHKAIEPVIFKRLEGNNYLDCKLIATYGLPHSYASDIDKDLKTEFWPSLDVQIEFDIKLFNPAMATNTMNEVRTIIKAYFNRLTSIHTPIDMISMDNNIYISQLIQQLEEHPNVAYLKFKGWYTDEKGIVGGKYKNADYQCIVQKWDKLEDMPKKELERYVPEMFVLDDANIILNLI